MSKGSHTTGRVRRILRILALRDPEQPDQDQVDPAAQRQRDIQKRIATDQDARGGIGLF